MICREKRTHLNPGEASALHPAPQSQQQPPSRKRRKPHNPWVIPRIFEREERGCNRTLLADLLQTDIPVYQNFVRMPNDFLPHCGMHIPPHQEISHQFQEALRSWIKTGNNTETPGSSRDIQFLTVTLIG